MKSKGVTSLKGSSSGDREYVQNFKAIHLVDAKIFQSGPKW